MAFKRQRLMQGITDNLSFNSGTIAMENAIGLFDSNRGAQEFFCQLLSLVCDYNDLHDLDKLNDKTNYYAIDLGDKTARVALQITTDNDSTKIKDTITKFNKYKLYDEYDRLIVFIIGKKKAYSTSFPTNSKLKFDSKKDIWDDTDFVKQIDKITNIQTLEKIYECLKDNLLEYKLPDHLTYEDIKNCINYIKEGIEDMLLSALHDARAIPARNPNTFIDQKNQLNFVSLEFFESNIQGHLRHGRLIKEFLSDPINEEGLSNYTLVTQSIQDFYEKNRAELGTFESVFSNIFSKLRPSYSNGTSIDKVRILLHNMYFNCDIGDNPRA